MHERRNRSCNAEDEAILIEKRRPKVATVHQELRAMLVVTTYFGFHETAPRRSATRYRLRSSTNRKTVGIRQEPKNRGIEWCVDYWMELPLFSSQKRLSLDIQKAAYEQRLRNNPRGLANSLIGAGVGNQNPLWKQLEKITGRVLVIVGE